jgi:hypothetical protein
MAITKKARKKLDEIRHPKLLAFRGMKIGPIFPIQEEIAGMAIGSRGVPRRKTKSPFDDKYRQKRATRKKISSHSQSRNR